MPKVRAVYYQSNREIAMIYATKLIEDYAQLYPSAIKSFQQDLESCLAYMDFPEGHHKHIRTTNPALAGTMFCGAKAPYKGKSQISG